MKYTENDLKNLNGKPVYIKSLDKTHVWKSGWAIVQTIENNDNVFASNGKQTILLSTFLGKLFEVYDNEPETNAIKDKLKRELLDNILNYNRSENSEYLVKSKDLINKLLKL